MVVVVVVVVCVCVCVCVGGGGGGAGSMQFNIVLNPSPLDPLLKCCVCSYF